MNWRCLIALFLAFPGDAALGCTGSFYLGEIQVALTVLSSDRTATDHRQICGVRGLEGDVIHRVFFDRSIQPVFGYDIRITPDAVARNFRVTVTKPAPVFNIPDMTVGKPPSQIEIDGTKLGTFSKMPDPVTIGDGDRVDVPVLQNPQTGARVVDTYSFAFRGTRAAEMPRVRDFPADAPAGTRLSLAQPHLSSEVAEVGENAEAGVTAPVVWVYGHWVGRFLFSATARPGYRRQAVAEGSMIRFTMGSSSISFN